MTHLFFCSQTSYFCRRCVKPCSSQDRRRPNIFVSFIGTTYYTYSPKLCVLYHLWLKRPYKIVRNLLDRYFNRKETFPKVVSFFLLYRHVLRIVLIVIYISYCVQMCVSVCFRSLTERF